MTVRTKSESLFEKICTNRDVLWERVPEADERTPDYEIKIGESAVTVEVKQLDPNELDLAMIARRERGDSPSIVSPRARVRTKIADSISQFKRASARHAPCMLCLYDNTQNFQILDWFAIIGAMYGDFAIGLDLNEDDQGWHKAAQGYFGDRKLTRNKCTRISAIAALDAMRSRTGTVTVYHNVFAANPIAPEALRSFADRQFIHDAPHTGNFVTMQPREITL